MPKAIDPDFEPWTLYCARGFEDDEPSDLNEAVAQMVLTIVRTIVERGGPPALVVKKLKELLEIDQPVPF